MNELSTSLTQLYYAITRTLPNYRNRPTQLQMVLLIANHLNKYHLNNTDGSTVCLIEAPTGTGKSLAYILSGLYVAQKLHKKLIIATATKILQNQLINHDIPILLQHNLLNFTYKQAKGRNNYLCPYQLQLSLNNANDDMFQNTLENQQQLMQVFEHFETNLWDGDLDTLPIKINNNLKQHITTDHEKCLHYSCPYNQPSCNRCPFYNNREQLKTTDIIITNHSLLLADITLGLGSVLPIQLQEYLLCIDEGHNFIDTAIKSFNQDFALKQSLKDCERLSQLIFNSQNNSYIIADMTLCNKICEQIKHLMNSLQEILQFVVANGTLFDNHQLIVNDYLNPQLGTVLQDKFVAIAYITAEISSDLTAITIVLKNSLKTHLDILIESNLNKVIIFSRIIENMLMTSQYIINQDDSQYNANVKWIASNAGRSKDDFIINAGLTYVGDLLVNKLLRTAYATVITSATLSIAQDFTYYLRKFGLIKLPQCATYKLDTTFDYSMQAQLVVPKFQTMPEFNTMKQFTQELAQYLAVTLNYSDQFGTLVLFFNTYQLQEVYKLLPENVQSQILCQTDFLNNQILVQQHKNTIDNNKPSIIFGLNSFAQGVDLPSLYCMHVIITKLPFESHKTPMSMVQEYWFKYEKNNYFVEVALPEACIRLIQAAGRLIRHETDYGQLTICDNRLIKKYYGKMMLDSLPKFNRVYDSQFIQQSLLKILHQR